jgi:hypothetical protein
MPLAVHRGEAKTQEIKVVSEVLNSEDKPPTLSEYVETYKDSMKQVPQAEFNLISEAEALLGVLPGKELQIHLRLPSENGLPLDLQVLSVCVVFHKKAWIISYTADVQEFPHGVILAKRCIQTFQLAASQPLLSTGAGGALS